MIWLGAALFLLGAAAAFVVFFFNSQTSVQLGPIPFLASTFISPAGLILFVNRL